MIIIIIKICEPMLGSSLHIAVLLELILMLTILLLAVNIVLHINWGLTLYVKRKIGINL